MPAFLYLGGGPLKEVPGGARLAASHDELVEAKADRSLSLAICILRNGHDLFAVSLLRGHPGCRARFMLTIPLLDGSRLRLVSAPPESE